MSQDTVIWLFLAVVTLMLVRGREVALWQAVVIGAFGYYLTKAAFAAPLVDDLVLIIQVLTNSH